MSRKTEPNRSSQAARARSVDREEVAMRIELQTEGGIAFFPGLNKPVVLNTTDLPKAQADQLHKLIDSTRFFDLPAASRSVPKGAADIRGYTITVEDGRRRRTVRLNDP